MSEPRNHDSQEAVGASSQAADGTTRCRTCGSLVDEYEWHPIRGHPDEHGEYQLHSFCSGECATIWDDE